MAQGSPWGPVGHLQVPPPWRTPSCISVERGRKEGEEVRGGRVRRMEEMAREGNEEEEEEMGRSEEGGKEGLRQQETAKAARPSSGQRSEGNAVRDRQTDRQEPGDGTEEKAKANVGLIGPEEEGTGRPGRSRPWVRGGQAPAPQALEATSPHLPTAQLPAPQLPAYRCPDIAHLQPPSWPGQRGGPYCALCPGGKEELQPCLGRERRKGAPEAHALWWCFIRTWEAGRASLKDQMVRHVLI